MSNHTIKASDQSELNIGPDYLAFFWRTGAGQPEIAAAFPMENESTFLVDGTTMPLDSLPTVQE